MSQHPMHQRAGDGRGKKKDLEENQSTLNIQDSSSSWCLLAAL